MLDGGLIDVQGLVKTGTDAMRRRDPRAALTVLRQADAARPDDVEIKLHLALAFRMLGDFDEALLVLDAALALEPYNFIALLSKGFLLERAGRARAAAQVYANAIKIAPPDDQLPPDLIAPLQRAREAVAENARALQAYLRSRTVETSSPTGGERFAEALDIFAGVKRAYVQEPLLLHYPRLPAIPFYAREQFPWLTELEAATETITRELIGVLSDKDDTLAPYIAYPPGAPVNQWAELNHSRRWSSLWLWRDGVRIDAACDRCPLTAALMERLPLMRQPGFAPTVVFSALDARTHIPPHTGSTNTRLLCHLPLILPGPARFRVGNVTREWRMGEAWVFDDTIEHEAWNDADELRVILILDVWNPLLSEEERERVPMLLEAREVYYAAER